ncbi:MAG: VWA-like domain-containing protein [Gemmiger sp.]|nr:VWA-like domain-containing protein [Gemmiger sp.]
MPQPTKHPESQAEWQAGMALRILQLVRSELYLQLRYMNTALCALRWQPVENATARALSTDGVALYYPPAWLIEIYRTNRRYLYRAYLHSVLHCIFRHLWLRGNRDPALWGLACDIAVEQVLDGWGVPLLTRPVGWRRQQLYATLSAQCRVLSAGPIYRALSQLYPADSAALEELRQEFYCDSHARWPRDPDSPAAQAAGNQWEQRGREAQLSQQENGRQQGDGAGAAALLAQVRAGQSRRLYKDFLRKFATLREEPHLDPDEFDLGYYSYGLQVYGNLPLIEPLETREVKRIRDFVMVLDTSDSTSGELVKAFLKETFTLLKTTDRFFTHCNVFLLQCDDAVQNEIQLTDLNTLDHYLAGFTLHGGGGTDFRPAFARIAALQAAGTLRDLKGVLYFTDGKGVYPAKRPLPPSCDIAFLFVDGGEAPPDVPPWAIRLMLQPEELLPQRPTPTTEPIRQRSFEDGYPTSQAGS